MVSPPCCGSCFSSGISAGTEMVTGVFGISGFFSRPGLPPRRAGARSCCQSRRTGRGSGGVGDRDGSCQILFMTVSSPVGFRGPILRSDHSAGWEAGGRPAGDKRPCDGCSESLVDMVPPHPPAPFPREGGKQEKCRGTLSSPKASPGPNPMQNSECRIQNDSRFAACDARDRPGPPERGCRRPRPALKQQARLHFTFHTSHFTFSILYSSFPPLFHRKRAAVSRCPSAVRSPDAIRRKQAHLVPYSVLRVCWPAMPSTFRP